jgi:hypothetical protein
MIHLRAYNESAGGLYRQVNDEEFERHKVGQQFDTFTKKEIQELIDIVQGTKIGGDVSLFKRDYNKMNIRTLKTYTFNGRGENNPHVTIIYPRTLVNNVTIWHSGPNFVIIDICKSNDEWFYVRARRYGHYICDGFPGLKSMLVDLYQSLSIKSA